MNRSRTAAVALVVFPLQILTGCFAYQPVAAPNSSPATNVQVRFTAPTSIDVGTYAASTTIDDVRLVQARVAWMAGDTVRLEGIQKIIAAGDWSRLTFDQASFTTSDSVSYSAFRFSPGRTALTALCVGGLAAAAVVAAASSMSISMQMK